jgi:hypothetical protein
VRRGRPGRVHRALRPGADGFAPNGGGFGFERVHNDSLLFAPRTPGFSAQKVERGKARVPVEPAREHRPGPNRRGFARQVGEDHLRHVLRQLRIPHLPQRRGIHQSHVPLHEQPEGVIGTFRDVTAEQLCVVHHFH